MFSRHLDCSVSNDYNTREINNNISSSTALLQTKERKDVLMQWLHKLHEQQIISLRQLQMPNTSSVNERQNSSTDLSDEWCNGVLLSELAANLVFREEKDVVKKV